MASVKTAGVGHFAIPTAPAAGASVTSGSANTFTTSYVQLISSTAAALYITGIFVEAAAALGGTYDVVQLATGGAGSETVIGQYLIALSTGSTVASGYRPIYPPIPVAGSARIAAKTADSVGGKATLITLECIAQSNVVDDGVTVGAVTTVTNLTNAPTAGDFTSTMKTSLNAATPASITGAVGSVTGAVGSVTGAVGSVTAAVSVTGDLSATMKTSVTTACTASTPTAAAVTGAVGSVTGNVGGSVGSVTGLTASNLDATVSSRLAAASYTAPDNTSIAAIKAKTDSLTFTITGYADINVRYVNSIALTGTGVDGSDEWRAA